MGRYINPFTDWGFKRLFGQEFSKDLLINFLNDLFEGEFQIKDVTFKDKEQLGDTNDLRVAASLISIVLPTMISISSSRCRTDGYLSL